MSAADAVPAELADPAVHAAIFRGRYAEEHPCDVVVNGRACNLSQEEHHRLFLGVMAENTELRRRLAAFENGA